MSFTHPLYVPLVVAVCALCWTLPWRAGNVVLLLASWLFYGWTEPRFLAILVATTLIDWACALGIDHDRPRRTAWLAFSVAANLGMLGVFKYYDFFVVELQQALTAVGVSSDLRTLGLLLPPGISFYTFQTMSYTIDVYRGELKARWNLLDYALYVAFFPQLIAGPIERAGNLLRQIEQPRVVTVDKVARGFTLALWGGFQKVVVADTIGAYCDQIQLLKEPSASLVWTGAFCFGMQICADFSGYTDIARGTARMLGFELVRNFYYPYAATNTVDFWRRWHISLSDWVRDYVALPLTRLARPSVWRIVWTNLVTFLLLGLWHGPSWNFVLLGLWYGLWVTAYTLGLPLVPSSIRNMRGSTPIAIVLHHGLVLIPGGLLFRERDVGRIWSWLKLPLFGGTSAQHTAAVWILLVSVWVGLPVTAWPYARRYVLDRVNGTPWLWAVRSVGWSLAIAFLYTFGRTAKDDFIYFQF
jgi:alginate O-acetyltransferase complex protein AlgI